MSARVPPTEQFRKELVSVFIRWTEESDMGEETMEEIACEAYEQYFGASIGFQADDDFLDKLNEGDTDE